VSEETIIVPSKTMPAWRRKVFEDFCCARLCVAPPVFSVSGANYASRARRNARRLAALMRSLHTRTFFVLRYRASATGQSCMFE